VQREVPEPDHLGGDVADAVHAEQAAVVGLEDHLEQPAAACDGTARGGREPAAADDVRLDFTAAWQEERGDDHLPNGNRVDPRPGPWDDCFGVPDGVDVTLTWPGRLQLKVTSREEWVVIYDEQEAAVCVEPQTGPPNGLNTLPRLVTPIEPLEATTVWSWRRL